MPFTQIKAYAVYCSWLGLLMLVSGCASLIVDHKLPKHHEQIAVTKDQLIAIGRPQSKDTSAGAAEIAQSIAMVGRKYTYMIDKGAEEINSLVTDLDTKYIAFGQNVYTPKKQLDSSAFTQPLTFEFSSKDNTFSGNVTFFYIKPAEQIQPEEVNTLARLGFKLIGEDKSPIPLAYYEKTMNIKGKCYTLPANHKALLTQLTQQREIRLEELQYPIDPRRIVFMPLAFLYDVITFPPFLLSIWLFKSD